jgi:hypothetical protein
MLVSALIASIIIVVVHSFGLSPCESRPLTTRLCVEPPHRRNFLFGTAAAFSAFVINPSLPVLAIPMVKSEEFESILRDSGRSIQLVEFAGSNGETVTVRLIDGTTFGISDVIESPTDPRSPLKLSALCRQYKVPTKFLAFDSILANTPKKKKVYMNSIVQKAAEKEALKLERLKQDEAERLAALYEIEAREGIEIR